MHHHSFNAGAALVFLDDIATRFGSSGLVSTEAAWDAAWIVCMTRDRRHEATARDALAGVMTEVDRLSIDSTTARANSATTLVSP